MHLKASNVKTSVTTYIHATTYIHVKPIFTQVLIIWLVIKVVTDLENQHLC